MSLRNNQTKFKKIVSSGWKRKEKLAKLIRKQLEKRTS